LSSADEFEITLPSGKCVRLTDGATLSTADLLGLSGTTSDGAFGEVTRHPTQPGLLGLTNLTAQPWSATMSDGSTHQIDSGRNIAIKAGARVNFGHVAGFIRSDSHGATLDLLGSSLPLPEGRRLTPGWLLGVPGAPADQPAARVERNPADLTVLGLKNLSGRSWAAVLADGTQRRVDTGQTLKLAVGTTVHLADLILTIRAVRAASQSPPVPDAGPPSDVQQPAIPSVAWSQSPTPSRPPAPPAAADATPLSSRLTAEQSRPLSANTWLRTWLSRRVFLSASLAGAVFWIPTHSLVAAVGAASVALILIGVLHVGDRALAPLWSLLSRVPSRARMAAGIGLPVVFSLTQFGPGASGVEVSRVATTLFVSTLLSYLLLRLRTQST
jgi:hypothetical protein